VFDYSITDASCSKVGDGIINIDNINSGIAPYSIYLNGDLLDDNVINTMEIANLLTGAYMLTLIDNSGCEFTDSLFVDYIGGYDCIIVPIIISPNNDGANDFWHPIYDVDTEIKVTILNRWGQVEYYYQGNSVVFQWDGLGGRGNKLPSADYYYIIKYQNNSYPDRTGVVTLIR